MKHSLSELLKMASEKPPPQKPGRSAYRPMLPVLLAMADRGHNAVSMTEFLIEKGEIEPEKRNSAYRSIRNLIKRHTNPS